MITFFRLKKENRKRKEKLKTWSYHQMGVSLVMIYVDIDITMKLSQLIFKMLMLISFCFINNINTAEY